MNCVHICQTHTQTHTHETHLCIYYIHTLAAVLYCIKHYIPHYYLCYERYAATRGVTRLETREKECSASVWLYLLMYTYICNAT